MGRLKVTTKRLQISKANATIVATVAVAAFIATFSLVASRALWSQRGYQARVIKAKEQARDQLEANVKASEGLVNAYKEFVGTSTNVLGGNPKGTGERDGDNARIVLDALPSSYDYPAVATSLEKLVTDQNNRFVSISGTDDQVGQKDKGTAPNPTPQEMPFVTTINGTFDSTKNLLSAAEHSIRPISIRGLAVKAIENGQLETEITAVTYYQPGRSLTNETKVVK